MGTRPDIFSWRAEVLLLHEGMYIASGLSQAIFFALEILDVSWGNSQGPTEIRQWMFARDPVSHNLGISES